MKVYYILLTSIFCATGAIANDAFNTASVWEFECLVKPIPHEGYFPKGEYNPFQIIWSRDAGHARMTWANGNGKGLREIPGFADTFPHTVHFWTSPATAKFTGEETRNGRYGGWVEGFGPTMISLRSTGEITSTRHDVIHGGMKAFSSEGTCTISARSLESN